MKPMKIIGIVLLIIVVLLILAYFIQQSNKRRTAGALMNQTMTNSNGTNRFAVAPQIVADYTAIDSATGKPVYIWAGVRPCPFGYTKIVSGPNVGWCKLNSLSLDARWKEGDTNLSSGNCPAGHVEVNNHTSPNSYTCWYKTSNLA